MNYYLILVPRKKPTDTKCYIEIVNDKLKVIKTFTYSCSDEADKAETIREAEEYMKGLKS